MTSDLHILGDMNTTAALMLMWSRLSPLISLLRRSRSKHTDGHDRVPRPRPVPSLDLIALFLASPLNESGAEGRGLQDSCTGVADQAKIVKL